MARRRAVAAPLGLPEEHFDPLFAGEPHWFGKLIRYVGRDDDGPRAQGVGPHADWGFLTLLLQDGTGGLEALPPRTHEWVDVPPVDGALVVNVGEMLEVATHPASTRCCTPSRSPRSWRRTHRACGGPSTTRCSPASATTR